MALAPDHKADLEKSGLTPKTIESAGIYSVPPDEINKLFGWDIPIKSLLAFPYPGEKRFTRYKLFPPYKKPGEEKPRKYYQPPNSGIHLYLPPGFDPNAEIIRVTEGEKKGLAGQQHGLNVCALSGIWNFAAKDEKGNPQLIDDLKNIKWSNKKVEIIPDPDFQINQSVGHAVYRLGQMLIKEGAGVQVVQLPYNLKLDDFLCTHNANDFSQLERLTIFSDVFQPSRIKELGLVGVIKESVIGVSNFLKMDIPPRVNYLCPWLKAGTISMIHAPRGIGKTWLCIMIALAVTRKVPIGKWIVENPAKCLYVDGEMASEDLQTRIKNLSNNLPGEVSPLHILSAELMQRQGWPTPKISDEGWRTALYDYPKEAKDYQILILDNLASLTPGIDENVKKEWDGINQWLLSLRFMGLAGILVHHTGKSGDQRGTSGHEDNIDTSIKLSNPSGYSPADGAKFKVEFTKARGVFGEGSSPFILQITKKGDGLIWTDEGVNSGSEENIIALLGRGNPQKEIPNLLGCSKGWVSRIKKKAEEEGILSEKGGFTEKGNKLYGKVDISEFAK